MGSLDELDLGGADESVLGLGVEGEEERQRDAGVPEAALRSVHHLRLELPLRDKPVAVRVHLNWGRERRDEGEERVNPEPLVEREKLAALEQSDVSIPVGQELEVELLQVRLAQLAVLIHVQERDTLRPTRPNDLSDRS